jgi:hypothetical protein
MYHLIKWSPFPSSFNAGDQILRFSEVPPLSPGGLLTPTATIGSMVSVPGEQTIEYELSMHQGMEASTSG